MKRIDLVKPVLGEEEIEQIRETFESGWVAGQGEKSAELVERMQEVYGFAHAVPLNNCTAALHLALLSLGIQEGDDVLVADYTFPATGHSVLYVGAHPIFVDIDRATYNLDVADAKRKITDKTKAIICVHTFGQMCDMDLINQFARENNLKVIEDCACAIGATYKGRYAGTFGDAACFSFHARKNITCGEGGLLVMKDPDAFDRAKRLSCFGMQSAYAREKQDELSIPSFTERGYNYKLSDINSAILIAQINRYEGMLEKKRDLVERYEDNLKELDWIEAPMVSPQCTHVYQSFVCLAQDQGTRNRLINGLKSMNIFTQIGTYSSCVQPVYDAPKDCTTSIDVYNRAIALPLHPSLSHEDIDQVVSAMKKIIGEIDE